MFDDLTAYYHENVASSYFAYREINENGVAGSSRDLREAITSASALFHLREHLREHKLSRNKIESLCPDYALLGDVTNSSKHKLLTGQTPHGKPFINDAASLSERIILITYKDDLGEYKYAAKTVIIKLTDGTERNLLEVLTNVINFWEEYMEKVGALDKARCFKYENPLRFRTRTECENNKLDFTLITGHRFKQSLSFFQYNKDTHEIEPMDFKGSELQFRMYAPTLDVDISLKNHKTGAESKKTISLSEDESIEVSKLSTNTEKQSYVYSLPVALETLRELVKEVGSN